VATVTGPVPRAALGVTLMHEHILNDCTCWWRGTDPAFTSPIRDLPVSAAILSRLKNDPFACRDNCALTDEALAVAELMQVVAEGGGTVVDPTCRGIGRAPEALTRIATATSLKTQKPAPCSARAWCDPPAVLQAIPCSRARRAVSVVPAHAARARSPTRSVMGKPISRATFAGTSAANTWST